jgi:hypothetical protein
MKDSTTVINIVDKGEGVYEVEVEDPDVFQVGDRLDWGVPVVVEATAGRLLTVRECGSFPRLTN